MQPALLPILPTTNSMIIMRPIAFHLTDVSAT